MIWLFRNKLLTISQKRENMIQRKLEPIIFEMLETFRMVAINGTRQSGKTTLQKRIAKEKAMNYYTFD